MQRAEITGVRDGGRTFQLNTTWTYAGTKGTPPAVLRYAYSDYPNMPLYNAAGLPVAPFTVNISAHY